MSYYLAIDIGASSGRHILGSVAEGKIILEEIYRFDNGMAMKNGHLCWNFQDLFREIKAGLMKCGEIGKIPVSMGIDTWGVDFVLLDRDEKVLGDTIGYRDSRTNGCDQRVYEKISQKKLYQISGIQKQIFNSIYQMQAMKEQQPELLAQAEYFLMVPEYLNYLLTGIMKAEYTNATTTQLVDPITKQWNTDLLKTLSFPEHIFLPLSMPGTLVGNLTVEVAKEVGFDCRVLLPPSHDTASAVLSVPAAEDDFLYISSGTWSLMGVERDKADCSEKSMVHNFTNEGGYNYKFRYLKNIMGLWMIQCVRQELDTQFSFSQLCDMAEEAAKFPSRVDVNDQIFLSPENMIEAVKKKCQMTGQAVPSTVGEISACIYQSLADCYGGTVREIEDLTNKTYKNLHIVGGGSNADYLNQLTANATGKCVYAGPTEATAIGNLLAQMIEYQEFPNVNKARAAVGKSFPMKKFQPKGV